MMNIIRRQKRAVISLLFIATFFITVHLFWNSNDDEDISHCFASAGTLKAIDELLGLIQEPLNALDIAYFLCYDSLWGALKFKGPLPWQSSLDLCVLNKQMSNIDEGFLFKTFRRYGLKITYNSGMGVYKVQKIGSSKPFASLTVFEKDSLTHQMRRVGWIHRMLPPNSCEELHCFPSELIITPLPESQFYKHTIPVPHDGIEIQKYLFPYSWWKEVKPTHCKDTSE